MNLALMSAKLKNDFPVIREPVTPDPQRAAVLVHLYAKKSDAHIIMTKRALHLKHHPGEISFPGGIIEDKDDDLLATALRETAEEIGMEVPLSQIVGRLPVIHTRKGFEVTPFVSISPSPPHVKICSDEVQEILMMPLAPLLATQQRDVGYKLSEGMVVYWYKHHRIWGASAKILRRIEDLVIF